MREKSRDRFRMRHWHKMPRVTHNAHAMPRVAAPLPSEIAAATAEAAADTRAAHTRSAPRAPIRTLALLSSAPDLAESHSMLLLRPPTSAPPRV